MTDPSAGVGVMGVAFVAARFVPVLNREWRIDGMMLTAASLGGSAGHGAYLMAWDSAGLALPFLATAIFFERAAATFAVVKRHYGGVLAAGGIVLVVMGMIWTGSSPP